jgi:purine-binding chemotaxis protein CheW
MGTSMRHDTAAELRREFDLSFGGAWRAQTAPLRQLLAVRVGDDAYAVDLDDIAGLFVDRRIVPVPTPMPELLGLAGFRGQVAAVYDLAALLGYPRRDAQRWLVLARHAQLVALAFDAFEAQLGATPDQIVPLAAAAQAGGGENTSPSSPIHDAVCSHGTVRPIIRLAGVIDDIRRRVDIARFAQESPR